MADIRFRTEDIERLLSYGPTSIGIVKDHGVYLVTDCKDVQVNPAGSREDIVFGEREEVVLDPANPEYDWDLGQALMGGDDFVEWFDESLMNLLRVVAGKKNTYKQIVIGWEETRFSIRALKTLRGMAEKPVNPVFVAPNAPLKLKGNPQWN